MNQWSPTDCGECDGLDEQCQACCEHEYDVDEGYMCLNCGKQGDIGRLIDRAMDYGEDR
jgi:hypothetical protein